MSEQAVCSCCGRPVPPTGQLSWDMQSRTLTSESGSVRFSPRKADYIDALYRARNRGGYQSLSQLMDIVYAADANGGPDDLCTGTVHINKLRKELSKIGWTITKNWGRPRVNYQLVPIKKVADERASQTAA